MKMTLRQRQVPKMRLQTKVAIILSSSLFAIIFGMALFYLNVGSVKPAKAAAKVAFYTFTQTTGTYTPITGTTFASGTWDDTITRVGIPFKFIYNNIFYDSLSLSSNGFISMNYITTKFNNCGLQASPPNSIAVYGTNLQNANATSNIQYGTFGTAPNRQFIIQWTDCDHYTSNGVHANKWNFQLILNETSNTIQTVWGTSTGGRTMSSNSCSGSSSEAGNVGLLGSSTSDFSVRKIANGSQTWLTSTDGVFLSDICYMSSTNRPPVGLTYTWTPPVPQPNLFNYQYSSIDSGSFIINMGIVPQTVKNALVPYGMVYDMIRNYNTPVIWSIDSGKVMNGADFTYNGVAYKGGTFVIRGEYITSNIKTRIIYWGTRGVQGVYTTSAVTIPVFSTLTAMPTMTIENSEGKEGIIIGYFNNAEIPSSAYSLGPTTTLTGCHDLWINPHGNPTWATHSRLYDFAIADGSFVFSQCHATSMMEGCKNTAYPYQQLNFLTTNGLQCYSSGKCGPAVTETHAGSPTAPFYYNNPADPMMQFMGIIDPALSGGSESWYIPQTTGTWRNTTRTVLTTSNGPAGAKGVLLAYGPAFGLANAGWVMYEAGHDFSGTNEAAVGAQRAFLNFMSFAAAKKSVSFSADNIPSNFVDNSSTPVTLTVAAGSGSPPYAYQWSSSIAGASFGSPNASTTTFVLPYGLGNKSGTITVRVIDACGRQNFLNRPIKVTPNPLPVTLTSFTATLTGENVVQINWSTASERDNDYFTIERSPDGRSFTELIRVKGAGNSNNQLKYSCIDLHPFSGYSYYRVKQTDYNGKSETFKTVSVKINQSELSNIKVYPNPFSKTFTAEFDAPSQGEVVVQLIGMNGLMIQSEKATINEGHNTYEFESRSNLIDGNYIFRLMSGNVVLATAKVYCRNE